MNANKVKAVSFLQLDGMQSLSFVGELPHGESNLSYLYQDPKGTLFVGRQKNEFSENSSLLREHRILRFLEYLGIDFAPRSILYHEQEDFHVIQHYAGKNINPANMTLSQIRLMTQQMARLHSIPRDVYEHWCTKQNIMPDPIDTALENIDKYYVKRGRYILEHCPDKKLLSWTEENLTILLEQETFKKSYPIHLVHGDLSGNMKWDGKNNLIFIDWEHSRYSEGHELAQVFAHEKCSEQLRDLMIREYGRARNFTYEEITQLFDEISGSIKMMVFGRKLWSISRYTEAFLQRHPEIEKYKIRAYREITQ